MNKPLHVRSRAAFGWLVAVIIGCDLPGAPNPADRPVPPQEVQDFALLFQRNCAGCHGVDGKLGPAPPLNDPLFLAIVPDAELLKVVRDGRRGTPMPGFAPSTGGPLTDELTGMPGARIRGRHVLLPGHGERGPTLEIFSYEKNAAHPPTELHRPGFQHLAFEVDDVDAKRSEILARGGRDVGKQVTLDIAGAGKLTLHYLTDPEGNILELQKWH